MNNENDQKCSNMEIIDLDTDEIEKTVYNASCNDVNTKQILHSFTPSRENNMIHTTNSSLLQDKNIGSTTDITTSQKWNLGKGVGSKSGKTLALIPIDCLKYCDMKDGKFRVKLNTLNKLQNQNSVYLYNVPECNDLHEKPHCSHKADKITTGSIDILNSINKEHLMSNIYSYDKELGKTSEPKLQYSSNIINSSKIVLNQNSKSSSKTHITKKKVLEKKDISTEVISPPIMSKVKLHSSCSIHHNTSNHKTIASMNIRKEIADSVNINRSIDLTKEEDSLVMMSNMNQSPINSPNFEIHPVSLIPSINEENLNYCSLGKTLSTNSSKIADKKVCFVSRNSSFNKVKPTTVSMKEVLNFKDCKNNIQESDPLGDLQNNFEPIVNLTEPNDLQNTLKNALTEGLRGSGIPNKKIQELETMIQNRSLTSPFKVMIPPLYLKYCTKKNGKYLVDLNALKRMNKDKQETLPKERECLTVNKTKVKKNDEWNLGKEKKFSPDQCRYFYMKTSAWDKFDPENNQCKGFNEREVNISKFCYEKYLKYVNNTKRDYKKLRTDFFITKSNKYKDISCEFNMTSSSSNFSCNDLYFTKKIDILDKLGRRVRTEHVNYNKRLALDDSEKSKKQKVEISPECMLAKLKGCNIVLERNEIVEARIKWKLEQQNIRKKLNSKFLKSSTSLNRDINRPTIILNENNFHIMRLDEKFCKKCNVMFIKNYEDDFPESIYKNKLFINLVEKKLIRITSPSVLQDYFELKM